MTRNRTRPSIARLLLAAVLCTFASLGASQTVAADWSLELRGDGTVLWQGATPGGGSPWRAEAIWTSAFDPAESTVLADEPAGESLRIVLDPPPGIGTIVLKLAGGPETLTAWASTSGPQTAFDDLLVSARAARNDLEAEMIVANRYGVRRPEARAMLTIADIWLGHAEHLETDETRRTWGRWWLAYIAAECAAEQTLLVELRDKPGDWTVIDDPPLQELRVSKDGLRLETGIWTPEGTDWVPVRLFGLRGHFEPGDARLVRDLGFNFIEHHSEIVTTPARLPEDVKREVERLNMGWWGILPKGAITQGICQSWLEPSLVPAYGYWSPYAEKTGRDESLAANPWRLRAYSHKALRYRWGETVELPPGWPHDPFEETSVLPEGVELSIQNEAGAPSAKVLRLMQGVD